VATGSRAAGFSGREMADFIAAYEMTSPDDWFNRNASS